MPRWAAGVRFSHGWVTRPSWCHCTQGTEPQCHSLPKTDMPNDDGIQRSRRSDQVVSSSCSVPALLIYSFCQLWLGAHGCAPTPSPSPITMQSHWVLSNMSFTAWGVVCCEVCGDAHPKHICLPKLTCWRPVSSPRARPGSFLSRGNTALMWTLVELQPGLMVLLKGSVHAGFETRHIMHRHTDRWYDRYTYTQTLC